MTLSWLPNRASTLLFPVSKLLKWDISAKEPCLFYTNFIFKDCSLWDSLIFHPAKDIYVCVTDKEKHPLHLQEVFLVIWIHFLDCEQHLELLVKVLTIYLPDVNIPVDSGPIRSLFVFSKACRWAGIRALILWKQNLRRGLFLTNSNNTICCLLAKKTLNLIFGKAPKVGKLFLPAFHFTNK